jgi:pSer/pThr/pTyr-binding forkhead associated (FHA) protein
MNTNPSVIRRGFVVESGDGANGIIAIPSEVTLVGRDPAVGICLPYDGISREHLRLDGTGAVVYVTDANSTNGTWVNGYRTLGRTALADGDQLQVGPVYLRYFDGTGKGANPIASDPSRQTQPQPAHNSAGRDQHIAGKDQYVAGKDQYVANGNQTWKSKVNISAYEDPSDELFQGRGPGRVLAIVGALLAFGAIGWFFVTLAGSFGSGEPPSGSSIGLVFPFFLVGALLYGVGVGMSRASRKRKGR